MTSGFSFYLYGKDYFVPSNLVNRTKGLAKKIISKLADPELSIDWIFNHIQKCDMEKTAWGFCICGDRYGNKFTLCIPDGEREDFIIMEV